MEVTDILRMTPGEFFAFLLAALLFGFFIGGMVFGRSWSDLEQDMPAPPPARPYGDFLRTELRMADLSADEDEHATEWMADYRPRDAIYPAPVLTPTRRESA